MAVLGVSIDPTDAKRGGAEIQQTLEQLAQSADRTQNALNNITRDLRQNLGNSEQAVRALSGVMQTMSRSAVDSSNSLAVNITRTQQQIASIQRQAAQQISQSTTQQTTAALTAYYNGVIAALQTQLNNLMNQAQQRFQTFQNQMRGAGGAGGGGGGPPPIPPGGGGGGGGGGPPNPPAGPLVPPVPPPTGINTVTEAIRRLKTEEIDAYGAARLHAQQLLRVNQIEPTGMLRFAESLKVNGALLGNFGALMGPMAGHVLRFADAAALTGVAMDRFANGVGQNSLKLRELTPLVQRQGEALLAMDRAQTEVRAAQDALTALQASGTANTIQMAAAQERVGITARNLARADRELAEATTAVNVATRASAGGLAAIVATAAPLIAILAVVAGAVTAIIIAFKALKDAIGAGAEWQTLHDRMTVVIGDARVARTTLLQLRDLRLGQEFTLPELADAATKLVSVGVASRDVTGVIQGLASAAVITGGKIDGMTQVFVEVQKQGRVTMEQLLQLRQAGFDLFGELERVTGRSGAALYAFANAGLISSRQLQDAWRAATAERGRYGRVLEDEAHSLAGEWRTLKQQWTDALQDIGNPIAPALAGVIRLFADWRNGLLGNFRGVGQQIADLITEGTQAARQGKFGDFLLDEMKRGISYLSDALSNAGLWTAFGDNLETLFEGAINRMINALKGELRSTFDSQVNKTEIQTMGDTWVRGWVELGHNIMTAGRAVTDMLTTQSPWQQGSRFQYLQGQPISFTGGGTGGAAVGPASLDVIREMSTSMAYARNSITEFGRNVDIASRSVNTMSRSADTAAQSIPRATPSGTPARALAYGPIVNEYTRDTTYGPLGRLQPTDVALSPNLLTSGGGQYALGQMVNVFDKLSNLLGTFRVADLSYKQPGQPTRDTIELRNVNLSGQQVTITPASGSQLGITGAGGRGAITPEEFARLFPGTDRAAIGQMADQFGVLDAQLRAGIISGTEFERKIAQIKAQTINGLIDPSKASELARSYGLALDDVLSKHLQTMAEIERAQAAMDLRIRANDVGASDAFINGWQKAGAQYRNESLQMQQLGGQIFDVIGNGFSNAFGQVITGAKSAKDAFREMAVSMLQQIAQLIIKMLVFRALSAIFGGGAGGVAGTGAVINQGGVAPGFLPSGHTGLIVPRYHTGGLSPNERLIIAKQGEGIFTPEQMSAMLPIVRSVFKPEQLAVMGRMHNGGVVNPDIPDSIRRHLDRQNGDRVSSVSTQSNSFHTEIHIHSDGAATSRTRSQGDNEALGRTIEARMREVVADEMRDQGLIAKYARR